MQDDARALPLAPPGKVICCGLNYGDHIAETGGYVLSGRARIYFGQRFEDYLDMSEGDLVFVPPFMPHVECNLDRNNPLTWMTTRTPENLVVNLPQVDDAALRDWADRP